MFFFLVCFPVRSVLRAVCCLCAVVVACGDGTGISTILRRKNQNEIWTMYWMAIRLQRAVECANTLTHNKRMHTPEHRSKTRKLSCYICIHIIRSNSRPKDFREQHRTHRTMFCCVWFPFHFLFCFVIFCRPTKFFAASFDIRLSMFDVRWSSFLSVTTPALTNHPPLSK